MGLRSLQSLIRSHKISVETTAKGTLLLAPFPEHLRVTNPNPKKPQWQFSKVFPPSPETHPLTGHAGRQPQAPLSEKTKSLLLSLQPRQEGEKTHRCLPEAQHRGWEAPAQPWQVCSPGIRSVATTATTSATALRGTQCRYGGVRGGV